MCRRMDNDVNDYNTSNSPKFDDHRKDKTSEKKSRENKKNITKIWMEKERSRFITRKKTER